jgi:hypothetical protein
MGVLLLGCVDLPLSANIVRPVFCVTQGCRIREEAVASGPFFGEGIEYFISMAVCPHGGHSGPAFLIIAEPLARPADNRH